VSGLIHISALGDDFYTYDEAGQRIFAKRSRQVFRAGQRVLSQVAKVDVLEARVDLVLVK
jgi:ribonuclease R